MMNFAKLVAVYCVEKVIPWRSCGDNYILIPWRSCGDNYVLIPWGSCGDDYSLIPWGNRGDNRFLILWGSCGDNFVLIPWVILWIVPDAQTPSGEQCIPSGVWITAVHSWWSEGKCSAFLVECRLNVLPPIPFQSMSCR